MLVRSLTRVLRNTLRVDKRFLASEPVKPQLDDKDGVETLQVTFYYYIIYFS